MLTSVGLSTSRMRTIDVTDSEPSLTASTIVCECGSMMPGMTYLPVRVDHLRARGRAEILADLRDLAVLQQQVGVLELALRDGEHRRVLDQRRRGAAAFAAAGHRCPCRLLRAGDGCDRDCQAGENSEIFIYDRLHVRMMLAGASAAGGRAGRVAAGRTRPDAGR